MKKFLALGFMLIFLGLGFEFSRKIPLLNIPDYTSWNKIEYPKFLGTFSTEYRVNENLAQGDRIQLISQSVVEERVALDAPPTALTWEYVWTVQVGDEQTCQYFTQKRYERIMGILFEKSCYESKMIKDGSC